MKIENAIVFNVVFALATALRSALDFDARHFGKRVVERYSKDARMVSIPDGAEASLVKTFNSDHLPTLKTVGDMAKQSKVHFSVLCKELETVRLAELARLKAEREAKEAMERANATEGAESGTSSTPPTSNIPATDATTGKPNKLPGESKKAYEARLAEWSKANVTAQAG